MTRRDLTADQQRVPAPIAHRRGHPPLALEDLLGLRRVEALADAAEALRDVTHRAFGEARLFEEGVRGAAGFHLPRVAVPDEVSPGDGGVEGPDVDGEAA